LGLASLRIREGLRPLFGFYGGKWRDADKNYPPPQYRTIVEPFAGSAGYSVRYAHLDVVLCDVDPAITAVCEFSSGRVPLDNFLYQGGLTRLADRFPACASAA
jgi:hypothetical protein